MPDDALVLLVMGGSLGAQHVNTAICAMKDRLLAIEGLHVIQSTGQGDYERVLGQLALSADEEGRWHVSSYIDSMNEVLAASDLVVSRAGASSLAEIMTVGVPAVLIPYPHARGDHQTINAQSCVAAGAARLVSDWMSRPRPFPICSSSFSVMRDVVIPWPKLARSFPVRTRACVWRIWSNNAHEETMVNKPRKIHFIGIGGVGMSGIALVAKSRGVTVSGSDMKESRATKRLVDARHRCHDRS